MDAIGLQVSYIQDGFLHITNLGGIDIRVLPGLEVTVHASGSGEELPGVIAMPPAQLLPDSEGDGVKNYLLSVQRAEAVRDHLVQRFGIAPDRLQPRGYGEAFPEYNEKIRSEDVKNRLSHRARALAQFGAWLRPRTPEST